MTSFDLERVRRSLPGRHIDHFESISSTMHQAAKLAGQGCPSGTAVVADEQTAGQGRHGHSWYSEIGSGLYVSIVLKPEHLLTLVLGLATAEAIAQATDLRCDLRWPNDILLGEKKVAGVLVQLIDSCAVAGIGINVNHVVFPNELAAEATSLRIESGRPHSREDLLICLLPAVDRFYRMLVDGGREPILNVFSRCSSYARGKRVKVHQTGGVLEGVTAGLDPSGYLIVRDDGGKERLILAGGVRAAGS